MSSCGRNILFHSLFQFLDIVEVVAHQIGRECCFEVTLWEVEQSALPLPPKDPDSAPFDLAIALATTIRIAV